MADNVTIDPGETPSVVVSTDDAGAAGHVQRVKLAYSADGVATHATVDADGVLVNLGANNDVTVTGSVTANAGTNLNTSTLALESGGNLAAAVTALQIIDNIVSGSEAQVDVVAALPAGDNNIGNVDIVTVPRATTIVDVSLASAATSAQLLAANTARIGLHLTNTDANAVYVYFGTTATATKFAVLIPAGGYYEMPQPIYTGRIDAIWAANGSGSLIGVELAA
jgi:hypothetical protein